MKLLVLNYAEKVQLIHISYNVNAVLRPFFPKTTESKVYGCFKRR